VIRRDRGGNPGLETRDGRLLVAGRDAEELARRHGTPMFVYDLVRLEEQARSLVEAFARAGVPFRLRLALKAQRDPQVLAFVRQLGWLGIDACSPGEVRRSPGISIGIRVNPRAGASWSGNPLVSAGESVYASAKPMKFRPPASVVAFADRSGAPVR
jgi:hypothetical protein